MTIISRLPLLSLCAFLAAPLHAQAVDYAALQETIGEPVTTSVTGKPQRASETPASIVIISRDQILRSPARDVPGLLKTYAGIDVNRWTAGQSDVAVRGGVQTYNARLLVLVNGRQVYLDHYGMTDWSLLGVQLEEIQQIELVRGPGTALFGFNAASGVVNIITVDALSGAHIVASAGYGDHGYSRIGAAATIPIAKNVGLRISGGRQREHERAVPVDQLQTPDQTAKRDEVDASLEAAPDARTHLSLDGGYSHNVQLEYLPTQLPSVQRFSTDTIGLRADRDTDWGSLSAHTYLNRLRSIYGTTSGSYGLHNQTFVAETSALVRLGLDNTLRLGAEYRYNRLDSAGGFSPRIDYKVVSASSMVDLHPSNSVALTFAGRLDRFSISQDGAPFQPAVNLASDYDRTLLRASFNAALLVDAGDGKVRLNGGRGYQLPSLVDFGLRLPIGIFPPGLPLIIAGDPKIDPVPVWSAELGYSRPIGGASFDGTAFYTRTNHVIASPGKTPKIELSTVSGTVLVSRFADAGNFETYGTELSLAGTLGKHLTWRTNYTWTHTDTQLASPDILAFAPQQTTPTHVVNLELGYKRPRWFATSVVRYTSSTWQFGAERPPSGTTDLSIVRFFPIRDAVAWDQKIGFRLSRNMMLTVAGENLTKAGGAAGSQLPADRRVRATLIFGK
jgi:outer membrane receptor for ferrienterochelin and colicins